MSLNKKLDFRQLGLYQIKYTNTKKRYYKLKELGPNRTILARTYTRNYLKLFYTRNNFFFSTKDKVLEVSSIN